MFIKSTLMDKHERKSKTNLLECNPNKDLNPPHPHRKL
jgi:hypothetical protein